MLCLNNFAHHLNSYREIKSLYLKRVFREVLLLWTSSMSKLDLASGDSLTLLHLLEISKLVPETIAPSWKLKSSQRINQALWNVGQILIVDIFAGITCTIFDKLAPILIIEFIDVV